MIQCCHGNGRRTGAGDAATLDRLTYFKALLTLQAELIKLQDWVEHTGETVAVILIRIHDPLKQWKLSPMDLESRVRWELYTKAKEETFARTNIPEAPWFIVEGNDKKRARLNCIHHLLEQIPYEDVPHEEITLPERGFNPDYERAVLPPELQVPNRY